MAICEGICDDPGPPPKEMVSRTRSSGFTPAEMRSVTTNGTPPALRRASYQLRVVSEAREKLTSSISHLEAIELQS